MKAGGSNQFSDQGQRFDEVGLEIGEIQVDVHQQLPLHNIQDHEVILGQLLLIFWRLLVCLHEEVDRELRNFQALLDESWGEVSTLESCSLGEMHVLFQIFVR